MTIYPWHTTVRMQLHSASDKLQLPHALLFNIEPGCGHEDFIWAFSRYLLCLEKDEQGFACGNCRSCEVFQSGAHPDFTHIISPEDKQVISVDQVRALNHFLELSCSYSPVRVALIRHAETMNINAANSLLKSLEEPAGSTHIILVTTKTQDLLPTIRSRCQQFRLPLPGSSEALNWLEESNLISSGSAKELLTLASGRPLYALALDSGDCLVKQQEWAGQLVSLLQGKAAIGVISAIWAKEDKSTLLDWQLSQVQSLLRHSFTDDPGISADADTKLASLLRGRDLWALNDELLKLKGLSAHPLNAQLFAENMLSLWKNKYNF